MVFLPGLDDPFAFTDAGTCNGPDDVFDLSSDDGVAIDGGIEADDVEEGVADDVRGREDQERDSGQYTEHERQSAHQIVHRMKVPSA